MVSNNALATMLVAVLSAMHRQGVVQLDVTPPGAGAREATYTVNNEDIDLVYVDKDNPNGFQWFQMYHIASPAAEMRVRTDEAGLPEVTVTSPDYNREVKYTFTVVKPL